MINVASSEIAKKPRKTIRSCFLFESSELAFLSSSYSLRSKYESDCRVELAISVFLISSAKLLKSSTWIYKIEGIPSVTLN